MPNRTAKCASAIFAGFLAGAPLTIISYGAAGADDECLSSPKEQTSQGGHWYYRIDHATKRHCWYLREEGEKLSKTPATFDVIRKAGFAENSRTDAVFGSGRSRRTTRAEEYRTAEPRQAGSGDISGCSGRRNEQGYQTAG